jgi:hypothetical protein
VRERAATRRARTIGTSCHDPAVPEGCDEDLPLVILPGALLDAFLGAAETVAR